MGKILFGSVVLAPLMIPDMVIVKLITVNVFILAVLHGPATIQARLLVGQYVFVLKLNSFHTAQTKLPPVDCVRPIQIRQL